MSICVSQLFLTCSYHWIFMKLTQNIRLKGQRSHRLFEVFIVSAPWLCAYLTNSLHILHKYNPRDDDVPHTISRSKGWRSGSHRLFKVKVTCCSKFLSCLFCGLLSIWQICFICGKNTTHEVLMCHTPFPFQRVKGASHTGPLEVLAISTLSACQLRQPRIFFPSGHCPESATNTHVSTYFR